MIKNDELINKVMNVYENRRLFANDRALSINEALDSDKEFYSNRAELKKVLFDIQKAEYENNDEALKPLYQKRDALKKKRAELLSEKGLSEKDLSPRFACEKCNDTGYSSSGGLCSCFYKTLTSVINQTLNIEPIKFPSFSDFKTTTESDQKIKGVLKSYIEHFPPKKVRNLVFAGATGTGKTFSAAVIADSLIKRDFNVLFLSSIKLNDVFLRYHTSSEGDRKAIFELLTECDLLIIDDLGTEPVLKNVTVEYMTSFLSERLAHEKPFIITTNFFPEEIKARYTERLLSRISAKDCAIVPFFGKDKRRTT